MSEGSDKIQLTDIKCNFCGKDIKCEDSVHRGKISCYSCYCDLTQKMSDKELDEIDIHILEDEAENFMLDNLKTILFEKFFSDLWKDSKEKIKSMSKRESSEFMFDAGADAMFSLISEIGKIDMKAAMKKYKEGV